MGPYYKLIKPGIVYGNALPALAAFIFASHGHIRVALLIATLIGLSLCIAASCVINNVIDRDIDARMQRTKARATVTGEIPVRNACTFAIALGILGAAILFFFTNTLALLVTLFGVVVYVAVYTPAKRMTVHSTIIGALAGAVPPVVGYVAVTNTIDTTAILLFLILVCWQMTHFFAIGMYRKDEYAQANLPIMPLRAGSFRTKILMALYAVLFGASMLALAYVQRLGLLYVIPLSLICVGWIVLCLLGFRTKNESRWARKTFLYSLIALLAFSLLLALS